jgi:hypothetical protein
LLALLGAHHILHFSRIRVKIGGAYGSFFVWRRPLRIGSFTFSNSTLGIRYLFKGWYLLKDDIC